MLKLLEDYVLQVMNLTSNSYFILFSYRVLSKSDINRDLQIKLENRVVD